MQANDTRRRAASKANVRSMALRGGWTEMVGISVCLPRCPNCGSEWIDHNEDKANPVCETCGQKLRKRDEFGYEKA